MMKKKKDYLLTKASYAQFVPKSTQFFSVFQELLVFSAFKSAGSRQKNDFCSMTCMPCLQYVLPKNWLQYAKNPIKASKIVILFLSQVNNMNAAKLVVNLCNESKGALLGTSLAILFPVQE